MGILYLVINLEDIWIISIAYYLFGFWSIVKLLFVWAYWIGFEMLFLLTMYFFYVGLLIDVNFRAYNVGE